MAPTQPTRTETDQARHQRLDAAKDAVGRSDVLKKRLEAAKTSRTKAMATETGKNVGYASKLRKPIRPRLLQSRPEKIVGSVLILPKPLGIRLLPRDRRRTSDTPRIKESL